MNSAEQLRAIIGQGYCIGCGACSYSTHDAIPIILDQDRQFKADVNGIDGLTGEQIGKALKVCPFSDAGPNEDVMASELYSGSCNHHPDIGYYAGLYVGHVTEGEYRAKGSSGGVITWLLAEMLERGIVDSIIHVKAADSNPDNMLFQYAISTTVPEVLAGSKSRYYPIETSKILQMVHSQPARYAFVGLPCFVKAIRRLQRQDPIIHDRIKFCIGLVCGHLKSAAFADCLAWQAGIRPGDLKAIDFRVKLPNRSAGDYGVYSKGSDKEDTRPTKDFFGSNWGFNFFRNSACDFCDDVFAETADVAVGDAWLPDYEQDGAGNSIIVVRNVELQLLIEDARSHQRLRLNEASQNQISLSQAGGLRDRREGLAYRVYRKTLSGMWHPAKRVKPTRQGLTIFRRLIYILRSEAAEASHRHWREAVKRNDLGWFIKKMTRRTKNINRCYHPIFRFAVLLSYLRRNLLKRP